jgi:DNA-binding FadR family transcriptional regulator
LNKRPFPVRERLGEQVAKFLLDSIRLREYLPGERLPSEHELRARLGVNRTAVREGLRWLEHEKFIEVRRGRYGGAFVLDSPIDVALERLRGQVGDLRHLLDYRALVEPAGAALAAVRMNASELAQLRALHERERNEVDLTREQARAIDVEIHELIAIGSKNPYIFSAVREIRLRLAAGLDVTGNTLTRKVESQAGHTELLAALERHDPSAASAVMERHLRATRIWIKDALTAKGIDMEADTSDPVEAGRRRVRRAT